MEWSDEAFVLGVKRHGESGVILEVLSREHGRHLGLVHGGASRKARAILQPGNTLHLAWRARLNEQLGSFVAEPARSRAGMLIESGEALAGLNAMAAMAAAVLPEREPHRSVFEAGEVLLDAMTEDGLSHWGPLYVRWEAGLLDELGFGLDLSRCAASGTTEDLLYVSPRSGRAVSKAAGAPYASRMFALPAFLLGARDAGPTREDILSGMRLTAHFLLDRVLAPHGKTLPAARLRLEAFAERES